ncbi:MAG TPA: zinc-ribbon domain-containing protein [Methanoregula sp.]|nr:zinc-ribbon domain-containing protein [Methanoregula sp.]
MDDPELHGDEEILMRTDGVHVKSISFEAILTNKRIILIDRIKGILPPKEIPLATVKTVEPGENAIRDLFISLGIITKTGGSRKMVLTFSREGGGNRLKERDEWIRQIRAYLTPSFEQVIRKVMPEIESPPAPQRKPGVSLKPKKIVESVPEEFVAAPAAPPSKEPENILGTYCTKCGTKVPEGSGFCNKCGTRIILPGEVFSQPVAAPAPSVPISTAQHSRRIDQDIRTIEPLIEKSSAAIPRDPLRSVPQVQVARQPVSPEQAPVAAPVEPEQPRVKAEPKPAPKEKKRFIPRLFSPKDLPPTPLVPSSMPTAVPPPPKKPRNTKKILLAVCVIVIILIAVVAVVVVLPKMGSIGKIIPGSGSPVTTTTTTAPAVTSTKAASGSGTPVVVATRTPVTIPQTGVYVYVNYLGGWKGTYGPTASQVTKTNSGERIIEVANATGTVTASVWKLDTSSHELTVSIYKDGKVLTTGSTAAPNGKVTLSVDATTGVAQQPVVSGSSGSVTAAATTKTAVTNTTKAAAK